MTRRTGGDRRPNLVLFMTDDHAVPAIGAYGSVINTTPAVDRLAAEGIRFDNAFCTNSICSPARASLLTGTYSHINGMTTLEQAGQSMALSARHSTEFRTRISDH